MVTISKCKEIVPSKFALAIIQTSKEIKRIHFIRLTSVWFNNLYSSVVWLSLVSAPFTPVYI